MITDEQRSKVAERLRILASHAPADKDYVLDALGLYPGEYIDGFDPYCVNELADLIDPTCQLVGTTSEEGLYGPTIFHHELSCGHTCDTAWTEPPAYCYECGCRVIA